MIRVIMPDEACSGTKRVLRNLHHEAAEVVVRPLYFISQRGG